MLPSTILQTKMKPPYCFYRRCRIACGGRGTGDGDGKQLGLGEGGCAENSREKCEIPDAKTLDKAEDALIKSHDAFEKSRDDIAAKLLDLRNNDSAIANACKQLSAKFQNETFGLKKQG